MTYDVVIVGAGVMGSATAYWLSRAGKHVALIDKHTPAHSGAASGDESRAIRYQYRGQDIYTEMVIGAVELWKAFDRELGTNFYREQGVLAMQSVPDHPSITAGYEGLRRLGFRPRWMDAGDLRRRFPQFANLDSGYFQEGLGGYIAARPATGALVQRAKDLGATIRTNTEIVELREVAGRVSAAVTRDGHVFEADAFVIAIGSWSTALLPDLPLQVQPTAARLHYLKPPDGATYSFPRLAPFAVEDTQFYGFPVHWCGAMKLADDAIGAPFDPDHDREHEDPVALAKLRNFLRVHMPELAAAEVTYSKTCTYAMTPDSDFVIDFIPGRENTIVATGFSGHGFKFGILIGRILSDLVVHGTTRWDLSRFRLDRTPTPVIEHW